MPRDLSGRIRGLVAAASLFVSAVTPTVRAQMGPMPEPAPAQVVSGPASSVVESLPLGRDRRQAGGEAPSSAASRSPGSDTGGYTPRALLRWASSTALPLVGVIALIIALAAVARRVSRVGGGLASQFGAGGRAPSGVLSVLGRFPIGPGQTLALLQLDRRILLVCMAPGSLMRRRPGSISTISEITDPEEVASILVKCQDERQESLASRFRTLLSRHDREGVDQPYPRSQTIETVGPQVAALARASDESPAIASIRDRLERMRAAAGATT